MKHCKHIVICLFLILASPVNSAFSETSLRAGVASMITPVSAVKYYQQVVDYIGAKLGMPAEMVQNSDVDFAFICSSPYVLDNEKFGVELLFAPQVNDGV